MRNHSSEEAWQAIKPVKKVTRKRSNLKGHKLPICSTGWLRYRSREQASDALTEMKHRRATAIALGQHTNRREIRVYNCQFCSGFHTTAQPLRVEVRA